MYARAEASQLRQEFWTAFGLYMQPLRSAEGEKVNRVNYKTGEKDIAFRMQADNKIAVIAIELTHKDTELQHLYFEQLLQFRNLLEEATGEPWQWTLHQMKEGGKIISRVWKEQGGASILKKEEWPMLISFFKPRIMALDAFWSQVKYAFEALR